MQQQILKQAKQLERAFLEQILGKIDKEAIKFSLYLKNKTPTDPISVWHKDPKSVIRKSATAADIERMISHQNDINLAKGAGTLDYPDGYETAFSPATAKFTYAPSRTQVLSSLIDDHDQRLMKIFRVMSWLGREMGVEMSGIDHLMHYISWVSHICNKDLFSRERSQYKSGQSTLFSCICFT